MLLGLSGLQLCKGVTVMVSVSVMELLAEARSPEPFHRRKTDSTGCSTAVACS